MDLAIGVDVGGTKVAAGVVDEQGKIVEKLKRSTPAASPEQTAHVISDTVIDTMVKPISAEPFSAAVSASSPFSR